MGVIGGVIRGMIRRLVFWVPLVLVVILIAALAVGIRRPEQPTIWSKMVGFTVPAFDLPPALPGGSGLAAAQLSRGRPRLLNIFASWCVPCAAEAPQLMALKNAGVEIDGIAVRDAPAALAAYLARHGNPYARIGADAESRAQIALGSSGVPESFIISGDGRILEQRVGGITDGEVPEILAKIRAAR